MTKLRWTTQAVEDVEAIRKFIANDSDAYADLVVARLLEAVERLERFPQNAELCNPCARNEMLPISQEAHIAVHPRRHFRRPLGGPLWGRCHDCGAAYLVATRADNRMAHRWELGPA